MPALCPTVIDKNSILLVGFACRGVSLRSQAPSTPAAASLVILDTRYTSQGLGTNIQQANRGSLHEHERAIYLLTRLAKLLNLTLLLVYYYGLME